MRLMFRIAAGVAMLGILAVPAQAQNGRLFEVSITNVTLGQVFSPPLVVTHRNSVSLFEPGEPALPELGILAEGGDAVPLQQLAEGLAAVNDTAIGAGPVPPGQTMKIRVRARPGAEVISVASMLVNTNDTFFALDNADLPRRGMVKYYAPGYDAGTEDNDELCANIPGPACGGEGTSAGEDGEGFIFINPGIQGIGDLAPEAYDWRNPVAVIKIRRL